MSKIHPFKASTDSLHDKQNSSEMCNESDYRHIGREEAARPTASGRVCGATHVMHHASKPSSYRPQRDHHHSNREDSAEDQDKHCKAEAKLLWLANRAFRRCFSTLPARLLPTWAPSVEPLLYNRKLLKPTKKQLSDVWK